MDVAIVPLELPENPGGSRVGPGWVPTKSKDREIAHPNLIKITSIFGPRCSRISAPFRAPFSVFFLILCIPFSNMNFASICHRFVIDFGMDLSSIFQIF